MLKSENENSKSDNDIDDAELYMSFNDTKQEVFLNNYSSQLC